MLRKIERREKRKKLRGKMLCDTVKVDIKVASDDKFIRLRRS